MEVATAAAGDFEKFMKWMNKEGPKTGDLPEGSVSQDKKGGSYTEHQLLHMQDHRPTLDPLQEDDLSGERMEDSSSEKSSNDGGMQRTPKGKRACYFNTAQQILNGCGFCCLNLSLNFATCLVTCPLLLWVVL